jgi:transcriptional regulator with XRE-family HTH domain
MTPTRPGDFEFNFNSLVDIRNRLNLGQSELAKLLGVPTNTLYRWETGKTSPDAVSLASIYSVAQKLGCKPEFFVRRSPVKEKSSGRHKLIVMWDFQNIGVSSLEAAEVSKSIRDYLIDKFTSSKQHLFKAFSRPDQSDATDILNNSGWRVWEDVADMDEEIINQSRSDCGSEPTSTILVLITKDGDYFDLIEELKGKGVRIFLFAPKTANERLTEAVGKKHWIVLNLPNLTPNHGQVQNEFQTQSFHSSYDDDDD